MIQPFDIEHLEHLHLRRESLERMAPAGLETHRLPGLLKAGVRDENLARARTAA